MEATRPNKRQKQTRERRVVACNRCRKRKTKCTLVPPCARCVSENRPDECHFDVKDRNITLSERSDFSRRYTGRQVTDECVHSYVEDLEKDNQELEKEYQGLEKEIKELKAKLTAHQPVSAPDLSKEQPINPGEDVDNPLLDMPDGIFAGQDSLQPVYVGEASCTAFGDRLLQCVNRRYSTVSCNTMPNHVTHPAFQRLVSKDIHLPNQGEARLLIQVAQSFIGQNYHLLERKSFFERLDRAYLVPEQPDLLFLCHLFAVLALGELYSTCHTTITDHKVPGTNWFIQAVSLLQDLYEVPSIEQVQILVLLSFYANALGRIRSAHAYCGIALRLAIGLGLHRSQSGISTMGLVQRETRRRVWWTLYLFDRMVSSKLGYPLGIRDDDIDVEMPSMDGLSTAEKAEFMDPDHLCAHARLARVTGDILSDVYCLHQRNKITFVRRVHRVLNDLRSWKAQLPAPLRLHSDTSARSLYTLHMQYNLCIIQTTRPILLHIFRSRFGPASSSKEPQSFSPTTLALSEACVKAARNNSQLLSRLRVEGSLAVFGYFDSHYLFSSTLVLIIAAVMEPTVAISELVQSAFSVLEGMANNGNIPARDYLNRLLHIRSTVGEVSNSSADAGALVPNQGGHINRTIRHHDQYNFGDRATSPDSARYWNLYGPMLTGDVLDARGPLDNSFIGQFLDNAAYQWPSGTLPEQGIFGQFEHEMTDEVIFGNYIDLNAWNPEQQPHMPVQACPSGSAN